MLEGAIMKTKIIMTIDNLENIPYYKLPEGYSFRYFQKGDEYIWSEIEFLAGEFKTKQDALNRFKKEFNEKTELLEKRCIFLLNEQNQPIGTVMAWENGRIHWVAIIPSYQGKGLSKPLLSKALYVLKKHYDNAYLTTQSSNHRAIGLYRKFGFEIKKAP